MTIYRGASAGDTVVVILRSAAQDERLSYRARGVLVAVMSRPRDWHFSGAWMAEQAPEGRDAVLSALRELEHHGYLRRVVRRGARGRLMRQWEVSDDPTLLRRRGLATRDGFSGTGQPSVGAPGAGAPTDGPPDVGAPEVGEPGLFLEGETEGETPPPPTSAGTSPSPSAAELVVVVAGEAQKGLCPKPARRVLFGACAPLAERGWTGEQLRTALQAHDWTGARPGAVITWLRELEEPPTSGHQSAVERPGWCGTCDQSSRLLMDDHGRPRRGVKCPLCHPDGPRRTP